MSAGFNLRARVWRYSFGADDSVGGAQPTGTVAYEHVPMRIHSIEPDQVFLQQGLETIRTFRATAASIYLIYERDEIEVVEPINHRYYGQRFRVAGLGETNNHPSEARGMISMILTRSERAHASQ